LVFNSNTTEDGYLTKSRGDIENNITAVVYSPSSFVDVGAQLSGQLKRLYTMLETSKKAAC